MCLLEQSLNDLVRSGTITREVALELAEEEKLITAGAEPRVGRRARHPVARLDALLAL